MSRFTYDDAVAALSSYSAQAWRHGLDRMEEFCSRLGVPHGGDTEFFHVGGTNGKGSTCAFIESLIRHQGYTTGATYSPYVYILRERFQANGLLIPVRDFASLVERMIPVAEELKATDFGGPSEFEFKTALAFLYWQKQRVDTAVLEVGLGGRLDSTNIVTPQVSVIVSIGRDHVHVLGDTLEEIAEQKAGIIKPGVPSIIGRMEDGPRQVIERIAAEKESPLWRMGYELAIDGDREAGYTLKHPGGSTYFGVPKRLPGPIQAHNAGLAIASLIATNHIKDEGKLIEGMAHAWLPGRCQVVPNGEQTWVFDGAHNPPAAEALTLALPEITNKPWTIIIGMLADHSTDGLIESLAPYAAEFRCVPIDWHRARTPQEIAERVTELGFSGSAYDSIEEATQSIATEHVLVTGSFYLLKEVAETTGLWNRVIRPPDALFET
ncbi:MAG: bifunctional folylpolyglutamate synthase/dihydrofolate synthase [Armatimonadetes bacterium]|nr:bifunctional folylpolyglutamate synthase/dihydrofolate synthase [Armatimonadota bacterium]